MQKRMSKKGQMTIFVITALVIIALVVIFFLIRAGIKSKSDIINEPGEANQRLAECVSSYMNEASNLIIQNGGYISKDKYKMFMEYEYEKVPYLCYSPSYYSRCINMEPVIVDKIEEGLYEYLSPKIETCIEELNADLLSDGFTVTDTSETSFTLEIIPNKIEVVINKDIKIKKAGETKEFSKFIASTQSPLYDFARITQRITEDEAKYTNSEYLNIMAADPWMDINKFVTGDSNKIYTLTDTRTGISWRFAVRGGIISVPS